MSIEGWFLKVASGQAKGLGPMLTRAGLSGLEPIYAMAMAKRNARYDRGQGVVTLNRPVVSIGNVTTGGTGKTPVVAWLCEQLQAKGHRPCVLMRGYTPGRAPGTASDKSTGTAPSSAPSDEAMEYGERGILCWPNPDRVAAAEAALAVHPDIDVFVMDDGHQHRRVARQLNVVLVDATRPFGFDHVLPRGLLREPLHQGLKRADVVLLTRCDQVDAASLANIEQTIQSHTPANTPIGRTVHRWTHSIGSMPLADLTALPDRSVVAACGIGNADAFFNTLKTTGANVAAEQAMPDHHAWTAGELQTLMQTAKANNQAVVTTAKDWVKWRLHESALTAVDGWPVPVCVPVVGIGFEPGSQAVADALLQRVVGLLATNA